MKTRVLLWSIVVCCCVVPALFAAETVHLKLEGKAQNWIKGESTQESLGRKDTIECVAYTQMVVMEPDAKTGAAGEVRDHFPITILKRLDKSSPQLYRAWRTGEPCTATFRFYRPNPTGDGTTQQFYTVVLRGARISGLRREVPNTVEPATSNFPPVERVSFTYGDYSEVFENGGIEDGDVWHANTSKLPMSDLNFDGVVNLKDFAILADEWMTQY